MQPNKKGIGEECYIKPPSNYYNSIFYLYPKLINPTSLSISYPSI